MDAVLHLFTAFGLSSSAGLNAYIPLLIAGLVSRYTDYLNLSGPFQMLENPWVLGTLGVLLVIEMFVDKVPALDSVNDIIHTFIRPSAGALLFAAQAGAISDMDPAIAIVLGLLAAGTVHATKSVARPLVTATTGGLGNSVVSVVEDFASVSFSLLAIFIPAIMIIVAVILFLVIGRWWWGRRTRAAQVS